MRIRRARGFTLVELLVVLAIVSVIAVVALPVVIPAISHRQVSESARIVQGALIAARDSALRSNTPHGIRFLPDPTYNGVDPGSPGAIDPFRTLASNRFIPIEQPPGYREGRVAIYGAADYPATPGGFVPTPGMLILEQEVRDANGQYHDPTSWAWNVRLGDKIELGNHLYTVCGPTAQGPAQGNVERFVNYDPAWLAALDRGDGPREFLYLVNGQDDDKDGYPDNGFDGVDENLDGVIDDAGEWTETEVWLEGVQAGIRHGTYTLIRRPVPSPGARETVLPDGVVVDLTGAFLPTRERSRLPVDPSSGTVDVLLDATGKVVPAMQYSSPSSYGMSAAFYHIWLAERSDLAEVRTTTAAGVTTATPLVPGFPFLLPLPPEAYEAYDSAQPTPTFSTLPLLPALKGEMRLLTLFARTGNLATTDRPAFDVASVNRPFRAPQLGD